MENEAELKEVNSKNINKFSEAGILAIAPAVAYYLAFIYEKSYFKAFGLPTDLVRIELVTTLSFAAALIAALFTFIVMINPIFKLVGTERNRKDKPFEELMWIYMPLIVYALAYSYIYKYSLKSFFLLGSVLTLIFLLHIFPALFFRKKAPTFKERLKIEISSAFEEHNIFTVLRDNLGKYGIYLIYVILLGANLASAMGEVSAKDKKIFYVPDSHPDLLVAKMYSDKAICISIDNKTGLMKEGFTILNLNQDNMIRFKVNKVEVIRKN